MLPLSTARSRSPTVAGGGGVGPAWQREPHLVEADVRAGLVTTAKAEEEYGVAFSPDGTRIAGNSGDQTVKAWNAETGEEILTFKGHLKGAWNMSFSPDAKRIVSGSGR